MTNAQLIKRASILPLSLSLMVLFGCQAPTTSPSPSFSPPSSPTASVSPTFLSSNTQDQGNPTEFPAPPSVSIAIKESTLSGNMDQITLVIKNNSDMEYTFGHDQILQVLSNGEWENVPMREHAAWTSIGILLPPEATREETFLLRDFYGSLPSGTYRALKSFYANDKSYQACIEFKIS